MTQPSAGPATYVWTAPSGVDVHSCVPPVDDRWWDSPWLHLIWSYASWSSLVLRQYGRPEMRRYLRRRGWW